ncbi:MAG: glycoside hydrolase family 88 protein [Planctomycetaceae bacterium]|nr:glycoside hydrolase family 88 protein [Planctomycetaceae bacterium]
MHIDFDLKPQDLLPAINHMWERSAECLNRLENRWSPDDGSPVFTVRGEYTSQGWTEWTQGFQFGSLLLQFDATNDAHFLNLGRDRTVQAMAPHVSHIGVHDHGFNNVSTYGTLRRLMLEGRIPQNEFELHFYELALKVSGAVQASRWATSHSGLGYIYSFNGPQSLFCDTIRSLRSLAVAHQLGHQLMGENDEAISLLDRLISHAIVTAEFNVYYGDGRDTYDVRGRVAHESLFNTNDGRYRCPSTQQGYSPFSTWTRGLAWIMLGYPEQIEYLQTSGHEVVAPPGLKGSVEDVFLEAAKASCDFYIENTAADGIPYWDSGAPGLTNLADWREKTSDPFNAFEPVDSSAAAIAAQGLLRLGRILQQKGDTEAGSKYLAAGLTTLKSLLQDPYLNNNAEHEGLLWHSVYHRPRGWDYIPEGQSVPCGESCQWGDYHLRECALLVQRMAEDDYFTFFGPTSGSEK